MTRTKLKSIGFGPDDCIDSVRLSDDFIAFAMRGCGEIVVHENNPGCKRMATAVTFPVFAVFILLSSNVEATQRIFS